jgi:hypothetical protein
MTRVARETDDKIEGKKFLGATKRGNVHHGKGKPKARKKASGKRC